MFNIFYSFSGSFLHSTAVLRSHMSAQYMYSPSISNKFKAKLQAICVCWCTAANGCKAGKMPNEKISTGIGHSVYNKNNYDYFGSYVFFPHHPDISACTLAGWLAMLLGTRAPAIIIFVSFSGQFVSLSFLCGTATLLLPLYLMKFKINFNLSEMCTYAKRRSSDSKSAISTCAIIKNTTTSQKKMVCDRE